MNKLSAISGYLGGVKNRYMVYQQDRTLEERLKIAGSVKGLDGVEICYPQDCEDIDKLKKHLADNNLGISAVNFRCRRTGIWQRGSFTSEIEEERKMVVEDLKKCAKVTRELGCDRITTCPLNEGHDYIFEMDYNLAYEYFVKTMKEVAAENPDIKFCIEYKLNDPRVRCLVGTASETLALCAEIDLDNVGVTLDIGHSLFVQERPAQALVMVNRANRLFHVHLNDNDKFWDWDMIPGSYNLWDTVEFIYYLKYKVKYDGWISYDVTPKEMDTREMFQASVDTTHKLFEIADRIDRDKIEGILKERNPHKTMSYLYSLI